MRLFNLIDALCIISKTKKKKNNNNNNRISPFSNKSEQKKLMKIIDKRTLLSEF
jgi:hypothetical protein